LVIFLCAEALTLLVLDFLTVLTVLHFLAGGGATFFSAQDATKTKQHTENKTNNFLIEFIPISPNKIYKI
jgi:hypothetical protein